MKRPRTHAAEANERRGIQSVDVAMRVLGIFLDGHGPVALSSVAKQAGIAASTTHRYLVSLQRAGLIRQDAETGLYDLGPAALRLGSAAMRRIDAIEIAAAAARNLSETTGETAFVSIWADDGPMIVRWFHGHRVIITTAGIGTVLPIIGSSTGRVFAAHLPRKVSEPLWRREQRAVAQPLPKEKDLEGILQETRAKGFAWIDGLIVTGLRAVAAPIFDLQGQIQATVTLLSVNPLLVKFPNDKLNQLLTVTREASQQLGNQTAVIGGTGS
jgi:DNA-binding IclR family transcriptional regulator